MDEDGKIGDGQLDEVFKDKLEDWECHNDHEFGFVRQYCARGSEEARIDCA